MATMASRLLMVLLIISRSSFLMVNGQDTAFYVNVALGKSATQSSTYTGNANWGDTDQFIYAASLAVDGKVATNFRKNSCSNTDAGQGSAWWEVDLEDLYDITTIKIYQRSDDHTVRNVGSTLSGKLQNGSYEVLTTLDGSEVFIFNTKSSNMFKGIRVDHSGTPNIYICLCEVQVFAVNVALGKPALQSSTYIGNAYMGDTDQFIYAASLAVDGKVETNFRNDSCSNTAAHRSSAWWEVDLEHLYYITSIKIYQRSDDLTDRNVGSVISGKLQDDSYEVLTTLNHSGVFIFNTKSSHMFKGIKVNHSGTKDIYICLCEVQVFIAITCNMSKLNRTMGTYNCPELVAGTCAHNSILTIQCNMGYSLSGYNSSQCINTDQWSRSIGVCNAITCIIPELNRTMGTYTCTKHVGGACAYNSILTIHCNTGYRLSGFNSSQCIETDIWNRNIGVCELVRCYDKMLQRNNGFLVYDLGIEGNLTYNSTVSIRCGVGYNLIGTDHVRCNAHSHWDGTLGYCSVVRCVDESLQRNNSVLAYQSGIEGNLTYNATVYMGCKLCDAWTNPYNETIAFLYTSRASKAN